MEDNTHKLKCIHVCMVRMSMYEERRNLSTEGTDLHFIDVRKPKASELYNSPD